MNRTFLSLAFGLSLIGGAYAQVTRLPETTTGPLNIRGSGSKGDASEFCVKVPNSAVCRTQRDRASETLNLLDVAGADPTNTNDNAPALATLSALAASSKKAIRVPPGAYKVNSQFNPPLNIPMVLEGAAFTPGSFASIGDLTKYPTFAYFKSSDTPDTDNAVSIGFETRNSPASSNYQKSGLFVRATTYDNGSCTGSPLTGCKDIVGITATGNVAPGTQSGRAYGMNITSALGAGATGSAVGVEFDVYNQTGIDHTADYYLGYGGGDTSNIYATNAVCGGNAPCDAAFYVSSLNPAQAKFAAGIRMLRGSVRDYILEVNDDTTGNLNNKTAYIRADGVAGFKGLNVDFTANLNGGFGTTGGTFYGDNVLTISPGGGSPTAPASILGQTGPVRVSGPSGKGALTGLFSGANDPTVSDIPTGYCADWFNTTTSVFKHWCNYGNTLRGVVMN